MSGSFTHGMFFVAGVAAAGCVSSSNLGSFLPPSADASAADAGPSGDAAAAPDGPTLEAASDGAPPLHVMPAHSRIASGAASTCAVTGSGGVKCWGDNTYGTLGDGDMNATMSATPVVVPGVSNVGSLAGGEYSQCVVDTTGKTQCWGYALFGMFNGMGPVLPAASFAPIPPDGIGGNVAWMAAGAEFLCAVTLDGAAKCWGINSAGQIGNGTSMDEVSPVGVSGLEGGALAIATAQSGFFACAITPSSGVRCWGMNASGQLGTGNTTDSKVAVDVPGLSGVAALCAGNAFACARTTGGGVKCWGDDSQGQLGDGKTANRPTPADVPGLTSGVLAVSCGGQHACALTTGGGVSCWGDGQPAPAPVSGLSSGVAEISAGGLHTCVLMSGGGAKCWGNDDVGQLGNGPGGASATPVDVIGLP